MEPEKPWQQRDPKVKPKRRWRVVIECFTEYTTVVEAASEDEASALATELFAQEDMYHGEAWEHLGDLYRVKAIGREGKGKLPLEFFGPDAEFPDPPAGKSSDAAPEPRKRGRPRKS